MGPLFVYRPTRELKGCLTLAAVMLPLAGSFAPLGGAMPALRLRSLGLGSSASACPLPSTIRCAAAATLFSAEEEAALEQQGAGHLPSWDLMPFRETFDQLQGELTRWVSDLDCTPLSGCAHAGWCDSSMTRRVPVGRLSERTPTVIR